MHIEALLRLVTERYPCTEKEYPEMQVLDDTGKKRLERAHTLFHVITSTGRIASQLEMIDHGSVINTDVMQQRVGKLLLDVMRLAAACDMTEADIKEFLDAWATRTPPPDRSKK
ncbi:MAG: hypothetical protein NTX72_00705 [Candidatus Uhrbacteria bacterium]|nr:hypothetical protein [Candidatus Uhrbacteria bacterium]